MKQRSSLLTKPELTPEDTCAYWCVHMWIYECVYVGWPVFFHSTHTHMNPLFNGSPWVWRIFLGRSNRAHVIFRCCCWCGVDRFPMPFFARSLLLGPMASYHDPQVMCERSLLKSLCVAPSGHRLATESKDLRVWGWLSIRTFIYWHIYLSQQIGSYLVFGYNLNSI